MTEIQDALKIIVCPKKDLDKIISSSNIPKGEIHVLNGTIYADRLKGFYSQKIDIDSGAIAEQRTDSHEMNGRENLRVKYIDKQKTPFVINLGKGWKNLDDGYRDNGWYDCYVINIQSKAKELKEGR